VDANTNIGVEIRLSAGYSSTLGVIRVVAGRVRGAAKAVERAKNWPRVQCVGEQIRRERSAEARSAEALRPYGKARPEGPSRRATVFMLRPAGPKVEARTAEAKFWV